MSRKPEGLVTRRAAVGALVAVLSVCVVGTTLAAERTITRAEAASVAASLNLRHSDVPTLSEQSNPITSQERHTEQVLATCDGGVPATESLAEVQSPDFNGSGKSPVTLSTDVAILPSAALVARDLAAITGPKGLPCLQSRLRNQLLATLPKGDTVSLHGAFAPSLVTGTDGAFTLRFALVVHATSGATKVNVPLYADEVGFTFGQAEVSFGYIATGAEPSIALERRLAAVLVGRARAAIG